MITFRLKQVIFFTNYFFSGVLNNSEWRRPVTYSLTRLSTQLISVNISYKHVEYSIP